MAQITKRKSGTKSKLASNDLNKKTEPLWTKNVVDQDEKDIENMETSIVTVLGTVLSIIYLASRMTNNEFFKKLTTISYLLPEDGKYRKGINDVYYCIYLTMLILFVRAAFGMYFGRPLARYLKVKDSRQIMRFAEQLWGAIIAIISFSSGIALIVQFPEHFRQDTVWTSYPILRMPYVLKLYYLAENGYWLATLTYLFLEKRRKDFAMMVIHHFSTIFLVAGSYYINFTSAGVIIHATMDLVDIFLPLAKIFNYIGLQLYCDISFVAMAIAWIFSRHYVFLRILHDVIFVSSRLANPNWDPANGLYYTRNTRHLFLFFLIALEVLFFIWLYSILKIIYRVVMGNQLEDIRSDDEE